MKKIKGFILSFAVMLGLISVAVLSSFTNDAQQTTDYYWFDDLGYTQRHQSKTLEVPDSQCPDSGEIVCERGYSADDFNEYGDPGSGLKEGAEPDELIMKVN